MVLDKYLQHFRPYLEEYGYDKASISVHVPHRCTVLRLCAVDDIIEGRKKR